MKNAFVLQHHLGDDGVVDEGMILKDVATKRFEILEKAGLVREATDAEVEAGYQPKIDEDESGGVLADDDDGEKDGQPHKNKQAPKPGNKAV